jgi:xanthosine utilization system XapX-like protein
MPPVLALHGVLGVAVGALLRSTTAAVGVTLMWAFVVEGIVPVVFRTPEMATWLPRGAIQNVLSAQTTTQLSLVTAGALIVGYAAALVAAAALVDGRREL